MKASTGGRWLRARWLAPLAPVVYLAVVFWCQPGDRMGPPAEAPWLGRLLYDDWDASAFALRGLNFSLGRGAGLKQEPYELEPDDYARRLQAAETPLARRYYLEYPQGTLPVFALGWVVQPGFTVPPAGVCDGSYRNVAQHVPETAAEQAVWRQFRWATRVHAALMVLTLLGLMLLLRAGYEPGWCVPWWPLLLPATLYFTVTRFDILPAFLTALSLACLGRRHLAASGLFLAAAAALKVYPILLAPLILRYLMEPRPVAVWLASFALALIGLLAPPLLLSGWDAFWAPYEFQLSRSPFPPTIYGHIVPASWAGKGIAATAGRLGSLLLVLALLLIRPIASLQSLLRRGAIVVIVFVSLAVFYSPQWILWLIPLVIPLTEGRRLVQIGWVVLDLVTYATFPVAMDALLDEPYQAPLLAALTYLRCAVLGFLLIVLAYQDRAAAPRAAAPTPLAYSPR